MYETGEVAPHSGIYLFLRHNPGSRRCVPSQEKKEVELEEGETLPTCNECEEPAVWRYLRAANEE